VEVSAVTDKHFIDWETDVFGFGYGTGEPHTLPALRLFLLDLTAPHWPAARRATRQNAVGSLGDLYRERAVGRARRRRERGHLHARPARRSPLSGTKIGPRAEHAPVWRT
jgi:hypothetical protein